MSHAPSIAAFPPIERRPLRLLVRLIALSLLFSLSLGEAQEAPTTGRTAASTSPPAPTPEAIRLYLDDCITRGLQADLITKFGTDYRGLDLRGLPFKGYYQVGLETNLQGADFRDADLRGADFGHAQLNGADFRGADLRGARFTTANFEGADLTGATIGDAHFQECSFERAQLAGLDFSLATLNGCFFPGANLDDVVLQGVRNDLGWRRDMAGASLRNVDLSGMDFSLASLSGVDLTNANLEGVNFEQADLAGANLTGARLDGVYWEAAILDGVVGVEDTNLQDIRARADREAFEARQAADARSNSLREVLFNGAYLTTVLLTLVCCGIAWRRSSKKGWPLVLFAVNGVALIPLVFFFGVQYFGDEIAAQLPSLSPRLLGGFWILLWPASLVLSLVMTVGGLSLVISFLIWASDSERKDVRSVAVALIAASLLTLFHGVFLWFHAIVNAPTV